MVQAEEFSDLSTKLRSENQGHKRRIQDLIHLAQETRERIDRLLGRSSKKLYFGDDEYQRESGGGRRRISSIDTSHSSYGRDRKTKEAPATNEQTNDSSTHVKREISEQIIDHTGSSTVEVGGISLVSTTATPVLTPQETAESVSSVQMTPGNAKKQYNFGTISLQVKL